MKNLKKILSYIMTIIMTVFLFLGVNFKETSADETFEFSTSKGKRYHEINNNEVAITSTKVPKVVYEAHVQNYGWMDKVSNGELAGTTGKSLRLEGYKLSLDTTEDLSIEYRSHVENIGWQDYVKDGKLSGTENQSRRLEAVSIKLTGKDSSKYDVYYRVHCSYIGWLDWAKNGEDAGSTGQSIKVEAMQVVILPKGQKAPGSTKNHFLTIPSVSYTVKLHNGNYGTSVKDGAMAGITGQNKQIEGIKINLNNMSIMSGSINYEGHIQYVGWGDAVSNGAPLGVDGNRLEGIRIRLSEAISVYYDVYYRVYCQNLGWLGWAKNGENAGSEGYSYRAEAIEIKLYRKDLGPKTNQANSFKKNIKNPPSSFDKPLEINDFTANKKSPQPVKTEVTLTTKVSEVKGTAKYKYYRYLNGDYAQIKDWSISSSIKIAPSTEGKYDLWVAVKDSREKIVRKNVVFEFKKQASLKISSFTANKKSPQPVKTEVTLTTKVSEVAGTAKYKYYRYLNGDYAQIKDWSTSSSIKIAPGTEGKYDLWVAVKDSRGKIVRKNVVFEFKKQVNLEISSFTTNKKSPQPVKTEVTLTTEVSGVKGTAKYKYYRYLNGDYAFLIKNWSTSSSIKIAPSVPGKYDIYVVVKDSSGTTVRKNIMFEFFNEELEITSFTADKKSPQLVGTSITLTAEAKATGTGALQYKFSVKDESGNLEVLRNYENSNTYKWETHSIGNMTLYVDVKDSNGKVTRKSMSYTVADNPTINVKSGVTLKKGAQVKISDIVESAKDWKGNDITSKVSITGLSTNTVGTQKVTVSVEDSYGFSTVKIVDVSVIEDTPVVKKKYKVNSAEYKQIINTEMYRLIAELREEQKRSRVRIDSDLQELARLKNEHMITHKYFDYSYNGLSIEKIYPNLIPQEVISVDGVFVENIYQGEDSLEDQTEEEIKETALSIFDLWKGSVSNYDKMIHYFVELIGFDYTVSEDGTGYATLELCLNSPW